MSEHRECIKHSERQRAYQQALEDDAREIVRLSRENRELREALGNAADALEAARMALWRTDDCLHPQAGDDHECPACTEHLWGAPQDAHREVPNVNGILFAGSQRARALLGEPDA